MDIKIGSQTAIFIPGTSQSSIDASTYCACRGNHLATASGDNTIKVWNFNKESSTTTLREHTKPVWSVSFHYTGDFLASCSMDHTAKLWDINRLLGVVSERDVRVMTYIVV
jgi:WD40 repeat protein